MVKNKRKIIYLFILFILVIDIALFLFWYNKDTNNKDTNTETDRRKQKICEDDLLSLFNLKEYNDFIIKQQPKYNKEAFDYYDCILSYGKSKNKYDQIVENLENFDMTDEEKEIQLEKINNSYKESVLGRSMNLTSAIATFPLESICPDQGGICNNEACKYFQDNYNPSFICGEITKVINDENYVYDLLKIKDPETAIFLEEDEGPDTRTRVGGWRLAIAYQFGKIEAIDKFCDNLLLSGEQHGKCQKFVEQEMYLISSANKHIDQKRLICNEKLDKMIYNHCAGN